MFKKGCKLYAALAAALLLHTGTALAMPNPGDRAGAITGWDMTAQRSSSLAEHLGKWVFIDFWASWCGPCMHELPNLLESTADLRESGKLVLYTVTLDDARSTPALRKVLKDYKIDYPVIYDGLGWSAVAAKDWGVNSIPATYLIDPQGNVVATNLRGDRLRPALDFFLNYPGQYVPVGLRASAIPLEDGSVRLLLDLASPDRSPLKVKYDYYHQRLTYAEDDPEKTGRPVNSEYVRPEAGAIPDELTVSFDLFGESVEVVDVPAVDDTQRFFYSVQVQLPGTEHLNDGDGIWVLTRGRINLD